VHCHPDAVEHAEGSGGRAYWHMETLPLDVRVGHGLLHRFVWDGGPVHVDGVVREGDRVAGFEVVELAGHARGLIGLWREGDGVALVSDCAVPVDAYNFDTDQARGSIAKLAKLRPRIVFPGHLGPLEGPDVVEQLEAAAAA
jgi:glyoxylase-like metal-dependent hydrolase (beta-lactamase superfamily II)